MFVAAAFVAIALTPSRALAREPSVAFQYSIGPYASYMRRLPAMDLTEASTSEARGLSSGGLPSAGSMTSAGFSADMALTVDTLVLPLLGFGLAAPVGMPSRVTSSLDGSFVEMRPGSAVLGETLLPGIGFRFKERRWMFSAVARSGVAFVTMNATLAAGRDATEVSLGAVGLLIRGEVEACRRIDPTERVCLYGAPILYGFGWGNGGTIGLKWELGE